VPRRIGSILAASLIVAFAGVGMAGTASAARPAALTAAREALVLTDQRLELMDEVMASKWFSHSPIQDPAQETTVKEAAVAKAQALGVAAGGTRSLFAAEIVAAKEVQLGWGSHWLYYGAPPDLAAPELEALRARLSAISEEIVALLPRLVTLAKVPDARTRVGKIATKVLQVKYLGAEGRAGVIDALLGIRRASAGA
jgi:chorismate mutase-like protein